MEAGPAEGAGAAGAGAAGDPVQGGVTMLVYEIGSRGSLEGVLIHSALQLTWKVPNVNRLACT